VAKAANGVAVERVISGRFIATLVEVRAVKVGSTGMKRRPHLAPTQRSRVRIRLENRVSQSWSVTYSKDILDNLMAEEAERVADELHERGVIRDDNEISAFSSSCDNRHRRLLWNDPLVTLAR
jgi:hypothetical protein